jgi:hypothetical protein
MEVGDRRMNVKTDDCYKDCKELAQNRTQQQTCFNSTELSRYNASH